MEICASHFFALHALQLLPILAMLLERAPLGSRARWVLLVVGTSANALLAGWTWIQALAARPIR